jgi:chemotaxis protein CheZ
MIGEETLEQARKLVTEIEAGNVTEAMRILDDLSKVRDADLFQELGKLTRELHEAMNSFKLDSRITDLAAQDIPDAQERLNYVITMTEQAANKTLTAVEDSLPVSENLQHRSAELRTKWERFRNREMSPDDFRQLSRELDEFFPQVQQDTQLLQSNLSDVLMAQDFQDLTGQIIRRVISLVHDVEESLVDLIRLSGKAGKTGKGQHSAPANEETQKNTKAEGPQVPGLDTDHVMQGQDDVDDLLSSLGF